MVADQLRHHARLLAIQFVLQTELGGFVGTELGVVAATTLGDVVKQRGQVQQAGIFKFFVDIVAKRKLVAMLVEGKTTQIANDKNRVLINGIGVKQVVLHASGDLGKRRDVRRQKAIGIHASHLVSHAVGCAHQLHEQVIDFIVTAVGLVDEVQVLAHQSNG